MRTYISSADGVLLIDTDQLYWVARLKRDETESLLNVLLAVKWLLDQINL